MNQLKESILNHEQRYHHQESSGCRWCGGGLAAIASIVTGCTAITYNPAALSPATVLYLKIAGYGYDTSHIYRYIMDGDPITKYQGMESEGTRKNVHNYTHGKAHDISTMINNISPDLHLQ